MAIDPPILEAALAELRQAETPNIAATAKKFGIYDKRQTLWRHFTKGARTEEEFHRDYQSNLNRTQEAKVITWIITLSARKCPPTPRMITAFVESLLKRKVGINWTSRFLHRHADTLLSKWLPGIDRNRIQADADYHCYRIWFENVSSSYLIGLFNY